MKVPLGWLRDYVAVRLSPEALAKRLTMAGLEVVSIEQVDGEPVLDLEITPNRPDCLSIIGVAREVAALTGQRLKLPLAQGSGLGAWGKSQPRARNPEPRAQLAIRVEDRAGCRRYIGRLIEGVRIGSSPAWMQRRLTACGARPINNVVDITNYVLLECGQPLHAFDHHRLAEGTILVRRARANELLTTLDGIRRALSSDTLVIADARQAVAIAGIMGGTGSEVIPQTTAVLLESAWFDPLTIRRAARRLGLASESSYRFERGVDPEGVEAASARAAALIQQLAGGRQIRLLDVGAKPPKRAAIPLDAQRLCRWLGTRIDTPTIRTSLARLSCRIASAGASAPLQVFPPSFRQDLRQEVDLYEELARLIGYDRLPSTTPVGRLTGAPAEESDGSRRLQVLRCLCASLGLTEAISWALVSEADLARFGFSAGQAVKLANPLSQDHAFLRPSLAIGLMQAIRRNLTQGLAGVRLFELGAIIPPGARQERMSLGLALAGAWSRDWQRAQPCDFFRLKGLVETLVGRLYDRSCEASGAEVPWAQPGSGASLKVDGRVVGVAGQVSRAILEALDLSQEAWIAELSLDAPMAAERGRRTVEPPPTFPPVKRDLSLTVSDTTPCASIERLIRQTGGAWAGRVDLVDRYTGKPVPAGRVSLTFALEYRDPRRTLTAEEADALHRRIGQALVEQLGAQLR